VVLCDSAVSSSQVNSAEGFNELSTTLSQKRMQRKTRIQQKDEEKKFIVNHIRTQQEEQSDQQQVKSMQNIVFLRMLEKISSKMDDADVAKPQELSSEVASLHIFNRTIRN